MALLSLRVQRWRIAAEGWIELRSAEPRLRSNQQLERVDTTRNAQIPESADLNSIGCIAALAARGRRPERAGFATGCWSKPSDLRRERRRRSLQNAGPMTAGSSTLSTRDTPIPESAGANGIGCIADRQEVASAGAAIQRSGGRARGGGAETAVRPWSQAGAHARNRRTCLGVAKGVGRSRTDREAASNAAV